MRTLSLAALLLLASSAAAQQGVNLAINSTSFLVSSSPNPAALGEVDFHFSYTFPGSGTPLEFTIPGLTPEDVAPGDYVTIDGSNAASFGIDWQALVDDYANHHPGDGMQPGPSVSIDTDLGTFSDPLLTSQWQFVEYSMPTVLTGLHFRFTGFYQSQVEPGTVIQTRTILTGLAYVFPEPSAVAMLLPGVVLLVRRRYHG
jgi:hypothetical protein